MPDHGTIFAEWTFPEFEAHTRGTAWYFWMTLIGGALFLYAIFTTNFLFALIIVIVALLLSLYHRRGPRLLTCALTEDGIVIEETLYSYKEMKDFRIVYEPPVKYLYITFSSTLRPRLTIALEDQNPLTVRKALRKYLLEDTENKGESFSDILARVLKI